MQLNPLMGLTRKDTRDVGLDDVIPRETCFTSVDIDNYYYRCHIIVSFKFKDVCSRVKIFNDYISAENDKNFLQI